MTDKAVKVGDVVAWDDVPSGAMVKCHYAAMSDHAGDVDYAMRIGDEGYWPKVEGDEWLPFEAQWGWPEAPVEILIGVMLIALNLTGSETANELRLLAEAFERAPFEAFERDHPAA